jgi:hypothetical protein
MKTLHVLKIVTPRGAMQVPVKSNSSFQEFMDRALGPYNRLRASQDLLDDALTEIHEGMVEDWEVIDWNGFAPEWISSTKA